MGDMIVIVIIAVIAISAIYYIISQKRKGAKCIGCSHGASCGTKSEDKDS